MGGPVTGRSGRRDWRVRRVGEDPAGAAPSRTVGPVDEVTVAPGLIARRPRRVDEPAYAALLRDPAVEPWLRPPPLPPFTPEEVRRVLARDLRHWREHGFGPWALELGGAYVGRAGLAWTEVEGQRAVELPWALVPSAWGRGLATCAAVAAVAWARDLGLAEVVALALTTNRASRRVMEKAGLPYERDVVHAGLPHVLHRLVLRPPG